MKMKIIATMAAVFLVAAIGCAKKDSPETPQQGTSVGSETPTDVEAAKPNVDKNLLSVEVTLPADMAGDPAEFDRETYLKENPGISDVKFLEDGSLWIKMSRAKHKEMMEEMVEGIKTTFNDLIEGEDTPYIKDIKTSGNYKEVEVLVDRSAYENAMDFSSLVILMSVGYYQTFQGEEFELHLKYLDADTNELIHESVLPEE